MNKNNIEELNDEEKLLNLIFTEEDFVKNTHIIDFCKIYTRPSIETDNENPWWLYSIVYSKKIIQVFIKN